MQRKIPMRQCMGCRERKPKRELIRVVRSPEGAVSLDFQGKAPGRGAYLCPHFGRRDLTLCRGAAGREPAGPAGSAAPEPGRRDCVK